MKLRPTQIVGLVAIVIFGGILAFTLIKGPRDPDLLPSGVRLSDLPTISASPIEASPIPAEPLAVGSQDAKDDLYCSGVVFARLLDATGMPADEQQRGRDAYAALAETGRAKLESEGAAKGAGATAVGNAWAEKARSDSKAGATQISFADCMARPAALPSKAAADPLALGSQGARDDLYCSGLIYAEHRGSPLPDQSQKRLGAIIALAEAGTGKLKAEGVATDTTTGGIADAHTDKAQADYDAKTPRIPLNDCVARAAALPPSPI